MAIIVKGGGGKPEEEKTVTAGTSVIEVKPSSGKVMKKVTVNPTPTERKEVTAGTSDTTVSPTDGRHLSGVTVHPTPSQEKTVTPTAGGFKVSPETGKLLSAVFVEGDSELVGENIKQGVNIFGVDGSFDNSHGAYVWKKYDKCPEITISFSGTIGSTKPVKVTVSSSQIDVSTLTESFFTGLSGKCSNKNGEFDFSFPSDGSITISPNTYSFAYNQSTHQIEIDGTPYITSFDDVTKTQDATFIDFIVSDDPTAYPYGGEQGGYWYERVVDRIKGEEIFFTQSTASRTVTIPHSLGVVPTGFHLRVTTFNEKTNGVKTVVYPFASDSSVRGVYKSYGNSSIQNGWFRATITNTEITIDTDSDSWTFAAGDEYRMIVWA